MNFLAFSLYIYEFTPLISFSSWSITNTPKRHKNNKMDLKIFYTL